MVEDFDAVEVCCETVVTCVEPEVCDCVVSGFVFVTFPRGFDVLPLCLIRLKYILKCSSHQHLDIPSAPFPPHFPAKPQHALLLCPAQLILTDFMNVMFGVGY
jgi:hypothetical protein